jgi:hypothetical protein
MLVRALCFVGCGYALSISMQYLLGAIERSDPELFEELGKPSIATDLAGGVFLLWLYSFGRL